MNYNNENSEVIGLKTLVNKYVIATKMIDEKSD